MDKLKAVLEPSGKLTEYKCDAAGNREREIVSFADEVITESTYKYNAMNCLETVIKTDYSEGNERTQVITYNYDKKSNQTGVLVDGVDTVTYGYGNLNRLTKVIKDNDEYSYSFNADGLRIKKSGPEGTTVYLYESDKVVMKLDDDGNMLAKNVYGTNLLTRTVYGQTLYYMYNGHTDVTALIDTEGNVVGSYYYDVWGNIIESSGEMKDKNSILYAGYQYDYESGLYYLNARMYDPIIARFLQEDTYRGDTKDPLSLNLYTYCTNNPILLIDPSGNIYVIAWSYGRGDVEAYEKYRVKKGFSLTVDGDTSDWDDATWSDFTKRSSFTRAAYTRKQELLAMGIPEKEIDVQRIDGQADLEATWEMWSGYSVIEGLEIYSHGSSAGPEVYKGTKYRFWENAKKLNFGSTLRNLTINGRKTAYISSPYVVFYGCHTGEGSTAQVFANNQNVVTYAQIGAASFSHSPNTRYPEDMIITNHTSLGVYLRSYETFFVWNLDGRGKAFIPQ